MRLCIIRHTIYDLKGYGLCRERHCLWTVPLLILDFAVLAAQTPRCSVWSIGGFFIFGDMEARQGSIHYNFVPGVSGKIRHAWRMQSPGNRSIFAWRLYHAAHPCKSAMVTPQADAIFSRVDILETALPDSAC